MSAVDDDATITQLATAWVDVFLVRASAASCSHSQVLVNNALSS